MYVYVKCHIHRDIYSWTLGTVQLFSRWEETFSWSKQIISLLFFFFLFVSITLSVAKVHVHSVGAFFAQYVATPVELTFAVFRYDPGDGLEAPAAAHEDTTVQSVTVSLTATVSRTQRAVLGVVQAEIWRLFQINKIFLGGFLHELVDWL